MPIVHGWEVLIEEESLDADALRRFGEGRGTLFVVAARAMGATADPAEAAGQGWALADLSQNLGTAGDAAEARRQAEALLEGASRKRWSRKGRALGAMAHLARMDLAVPPGSQVETGAPHRVGRLLWHRLTGR